MTQTRLDINEIARRAKALYAERIRGEVETPDNIGKMVIIDVETGDYHMDKSGLESARLLHAKHPNAQLYGIRIGYRAADVIGGGMERVSPI